MGRNREACDGLFPLFTSSHVQEIAVLETRIKHLLPAPSPNFPTTPKLPAPPEILELPPLLTERFHPLILVWQTFTQKPKFHEHSKTLQPTIFRKGIAEKALFASDGRLCIKLKAN